MNPNDQIPEQMRVELLTQQAMLKDLLDAIELNDVARETMLVQVRQIEVGLKKVRQAA
jgi:hypothetical protein